MKSCVGFKKNRTFAPYILLSMLVGVLTGVLIFCFKVAASDVIHASERIYAFVRQNPGYIPLLIGGAAAIGVIAALILKFARECRGGGIPTAVASIRGLIPMKWGQGIFVLFASALLTYLVGVPLGNEGPSVQMGAGVGKGSSHVMGKRKRAWERYLMTGGACAGFAIATGAPLSGIMFAVEEAHRRFSVHLFAVASVSVIFGTVTQRYLAYFFGVSTKLFDLSITEVMPMRYLWAAIVVGAACGVGSLLFTTAYRAVKKISKSGAGKIPFTVKIVLIFAVTAALGLLSANFIGTGHSLIEEILHGKVIWYAILIAFVVRAVVMICANNEGVTGGIFIPNLAFGAMIASLVTEGLIALGLVDGQYYVILVVVGMASFLAAASRTPITAVIFAAEALCVAGNMIPVVFGVTVSYLIAEVSGKLSFTDTVIESRAEAAHHGITPLIVDSFMTVQRGSFADGMEIRDILWPSTCAVLSVDKTASHSVQRGEHQIYAGDILHLHYQTYDPESTMQTLIAIMGEQPAEQLREQTHHGSDEHLVPAD